MGPPSESVPRAPPTLKDLWQSQSFGQVQCPICQVSLPRQRINAHLDLNQCTPPPVPAPPVSQAELFSDSDPELESVPPSPATPPRARDYAFEACTAQFFSPSQVHALSPSPSASSASGGLATPTRASPSQRARQRGRPSPRRAQRSLFSPRRAHVPLTQTKRVDPEHVPYYVLNFWSILNGVLDETEDRHLFHPEEIDLVADFRTLSLSGQKLYVRLFGRKLGWLALHHIKYDEIPDLSAALQELHAHQLLHTGADLDDLAALLKLLPAPDVRLLCKDMNIKAKGTQKGDFIEAALKHAKKKSFFTQTDTSEIVRKRAAKMVGDCYKLREEPRRAACAIEAKMAEAFEKKDWLEAEKVHLEAKDVFQAILDHEANQVKAKNLPPFLRKFTRGAVLAFVLTKGVDVLERNKKHAQAVELIQRLLNQDVYLPDYRGHWYERLVLDLDQHLKKPQISLEKVIQGLDDANVREARKLSLFQRVDKICGAKKNADLKSQLNLVRARPDWRLIPETPKVTIQGRLMPKDNLPGSKTVFVFDTGNNSSILCSVEGYAKEHYKTLGFPQGLHGEGAVVNTITALLFWDILYDLDVPDAFRSPNQAAPLDFNSDNFYSSRREPIDERLDNLIEWTDDELVTFIRDRWEKSEGVISLVNWELFHGGVDHILGLIHCFKRCQLRGICDRLIKNHRYTRSGFPDLTVWNPETKAVEIVEVKGPNDRLSNKQILWIDYLNRLGVKAVACHVEAIGGKRLLRSPLKTPKSPKKSSPKRSNRKRKPKVDESNSDSAKKLRNSSRNDSEDDFT
eukprot:maker-scaffold384_size188899-snap-gene-0.29 protein:Tk06449 transcript:maker-scaffold384_size188899-snap-gene-0.29-mRNA-1 annotation:"coiled-coil domain-containing protein mtmr15"